MADMNTPRRGYVGNLARRLEEGSEDFLKVWKTGAKRPDRIGDVTYGALRLLHGGVGVAVRSLGRLEKATVPPARTVSGRAERAPAEPSRGRAHPAPRHAGPAGKPPTGASGS